MGRAKIRDLRDWIDFLDKKGELKRITAAVDWNEELGTLTRRVSSQAGPALLFENIKGYPKKGSISSRLFTNWIFDITEGQVATMHRNSAETVPEPRKDASKRRRWLAMVCM